MLGRRLPWEGPWLNTENTLLLAECITIPNFVALQFMPNIVALGRTVHSSGVGSVREYVFYVFFFRFQKNMTFYVFLK